MSNILDRIQPIEEVEEYWRYLIYGQPGSGKTTLAAGAPGALFLDSEKGTKSLQNKVEFAKILRLPVDKPKDVEDFIFESRKGPVPGIETLVLDTISEFQKKHLDSLLKAAHLKEDKRNPYLPFQQDYRENTEYLRRIVMALYELPYNIIILGHAKEEKEEDTGTITVRPDCTPKLTQTLVALMDLIAYLQLEVDRKTGEETRLLQVKPSRRVTAKTRIDFPEAVLRNPSFSDLLGKKRLEKALIPVEYAETETKTDTQPNEEKSA